MGHELSALTSGTVFKVVKPGAESNKKVTKFYPQIVGNRELHGFK